MKIEFELDPERLKKTIEYAVGRTISINYDGELRGTLGPELTTVIHDEIKRAFAEIDLRTLIVATIENNAKPALESAIKAKLKTLAREAVKGAMAEREDD